MIIRTKTGVVAPDRLPGFGTFLVPGVDPDGVDVPAELLRGIRLDLLPKMDKQTIEAIIGLYVAYMRETKSVDSDQEVGVVFLKDTETGTKWRVLVPTQEVGGASVDIDFTKPLVDLITGEEVKEWPPAGWAHAGSSHSHNTMGAFFSSTDDKSELRINGLHFVLGDFRKQDGEWKCRAAVSVVYRGIRYRHVIGEDGKLADMVLTDFTEAPDKPGEFHENVKKIVTEHKYPLSYMQGGFGWCDEDDARWAAWRAANPVQSSTPSPSDFYPTPKNIDDFLDIVKEARWVYPVFSYAKLSKAAGKERIKVEATGMVQSERGKMKFIDGTVGYDPMMMQCYALLQDETWAYVFPVKEPSVAGIVERQKDNTPTHYAPETYKEPKYPPRTEENSKDLRSIKVWVGDKGKLKGIRSTDFSPADVRELLEQWLEDAMSGDKELEDVLMDFVAGFEADYDDNNPGGQVL